MTRILLIGDDSGFGDIVRRKLERASKEYLLDRVCKAPEGIGRILSRMHGIVVGDVRLSQGDIRRDLSKASITEKDLNNVVCTCVSDAGSAGIPYEGFFGRQGGAVCSGIYN